MQGYERKRPGVSQQPASEPQARWHRSGQLLVLASCLSALAACAGSHENEPPAATPASEPREATPLQPPAAQTPYAPARPEPAPVPADPSPLPRENSSGMSPNAPAPASERLGPGRHSAPGAAAESGTSLRAPDNTERNQRDRNDATLTPPDQNENMSDVQLSAAIRRAIVGDGELSFDAKNIKIIANGGQVTLRGPVKSAAEKARVEALARQSAGTARVTSQLEIAK